MSEELTTRPMLEAILEGQRHIVSQLVELRTASDSLAAKQDDLAARQERLELRMAELGREVRDGLYATNRAIEVNSAKGRVAHFTL